MNQIFKKGLLGASLIFLFIGCKEVAIEDGRVPAEYLEQAQTMAGHYVGSFDGKKAELVIEFVGDQPRLIYSDEYGTDPLGGDCRSQIGVLNRVLLVKEKKTYELSRADFAFDPGKCRYIQGRNFVLNIKNKNKITAEIFSHNDYEQRCEPVGVPNGGTTCRTIEKPVYLWGQFKRQEQ